MELYGGKSRRLLFSRFFSKKIFGKLFKRGFADELITIRHKMAK